MALSLDDVTRLAQLARIALEEAEARAVLADLEAVFRLVGQMQAVDTSGIEPMSHPLDLAQRLREDRVTETDQRELLLANAPRTEGGFFLVPKVIE